MKLNFSHLLALVTFVLIVSAGSTASAQDGSPNDFPELSPPYQETNLHEDKTLLYEPEGGKIQREQPVNTQNSSTTRPKPKAAEPQKSGTAKTEEDALSFNFLYYIIQKFKTSDIVDK